MNQIGLFPVRAKGRSAGLGIEETRELDRIQFQLMEWDPSLSLQGAYQAAWLEMERREKAKDPIQTA